MSEQAPQGLYLRPPHGELSFAGTKTALAKAREFGIEGQAWTLCSGNYAYGELALGGPESVGIKEFDARFGEHRVSVKERTRWWPEAEELFLYAYKEWRPFGKPRRVAVPAGVQTLMGPVEFLSEEGNMGQDVSININTGGVAEPAAEEARKAPCEECPENKGDKGLEEGRKIWTAADATEHTEAANTPKKRNQWKSTANSVLTDCLDAISGTPTAAQRSKCEGKAIRIANAAVKEIDNSKGLSLQDVDAMVRQHIMETMGPQPVDMPETADTRPYPRIEHVGLNEATVKQAGEWFRIPFKVKKDSVDFGDPEPLELVPKGKKEVTEEFGEGYKAELVQEFDALGLGDKDLGDDEKAALTSAQRRALPEASFAWVEKGEGCEKGEDGKRPLRCLHLPYKEKDGSLDCPRVRNARARIPQMSGVPSSAKSKIAKAQEKCTAQTEKGVSLESLKQDLKADFGSALKVIADVFGRLRGVEEPGLLVGDAGFKAFEVEDGPAWMLTWTTNAFKDREKEIFTTKAIEDYAARAFKEIQEKGSKGRMDFLHILGSEFGDIKFAGAVGRYLVEMATFDEDDEVGRAFKEFFCGYPELQEEIAPEGWKASHRYQFKEGDRADGVYNWFDKDRTSILPAHRASNPYTSMEVLTKMLDNEQEDALRKIGEGIGQSDLLDVIVGRGEAKTKKLEEAGVAHKEVKKEVKEDEPGETPPEEAGDETTLADEQIRGVAERVVQLMQMENLGKMIQGQTDALGALAKGQEELSTRVEGIEKGDLERIKEVEAKRPLVPWWRASTAKETILDPTKDKELGGKQPVTPKAIEGVSEKLAGGRA